MNFQKILFYIAKVMVSLIFLLSASMYIFKNELAVQAFQSLGFPIYLIYPLAIVKILGVIAIWANVSKLLKEWAYAGFFFDAVLALMAHQHAQDGGTSFALIALIFLVIARFFENKI